MSSTFKTLTAFFGGLLTALTFIFGSGAYWQYRESTLKAEQAQIERISRISELRKQASNVLYEAIQNVKKHEEAVKNHRETKDQKFRYESNRIWSYLRSLIEDYKQLEKELAQLENRTPRNIDDSLPPEAPTGIKVQ